MTSPDWLRAALKMPVTIYFRDPVGTDEYGNVEYGEDRTITTNCFIQPVSQQEIQDGRAMVGSFLAHFGAELAPVLNGFARLVVLGVSYEAVGPAAVYPDIDSGAAHHVELYLTQSAA
jgi:hypothetical protein